MGRDHRRSPVADSANRSPWRLVPGGDFCASHHRPPAARYVQRWQPGHLHSSGLGGRGRTNCRHARGIARMKPFKALLVEGTSGVGKSTLIDALIRRHVNSSKPRKIRSMVHLAQSHTYGPLALLEDRTLTVDANLQHLDRIGGLLQWLHENVQEHTRPWCFVLLDTLHLTHCVRPGVVQWS